MRLKERCIVIYPINITYGEICNGNPYEVLCYPKDASLVIQGSY